MATEKTYNGDGSDTTFDITFPYLTHADIGVSVGGVTKTVGTDYTISGNTVTFGTAPASGTDNVKLYRNTDIDNPEHEYSAGSSITAARLNENQRQALYAIEEAKLVTTTSGGITTGNKNDITVNSDTDWVIRANAVEKSMMADNSVGTDEIETNAVTAAEIAANAVGASELADNAVDTAAIANDAVTYPKLQNIATANRVLGRASAGEVQEVQVATDMIVDLAATQAKIDNQAVNEAKLQISNTGTNGQYLQKQSGNTGGLTWATPNPAGSVLETFTLPCTGQSITIQSGTYTATDVTAKQQPADDNYFDINGSSIAYTPPTGTQLVIYKFTYFTAHINDWTLNSQKLWIDSTEVVKARQSFGHGYRTESFVTFEWPILIQSTLNSDDIANGLLKTWTSNKTIKIQTRRYNSSHQMKLHETVYWEGGGATNIVKPIISITAIS